LRRINKKKITTEQIIRQEIVDGRLRQNLNVLILCQGPTGSGKSYSMIALCDEATKQYGTDFCVEDICFTTLQFVRRFKEISARPDQGRGRFLILDESGVAQNSRTSMSTQNVTMSELLEMMRASLISVGFCVPAGAMTDKNIRRLHHFILTCQPINRKTAPPWQRNLSTCRIYKVLQKGMPNESETEVPVACPVVSVESTNKSGERFVRSVRVPQIWFRKANAELLKLYEIEKRKHFMATVNAADAKLSKMEAKMNAKLGILPEPPKSVEQVSENIPIPDVRRSDLISNMIRGRRVA